MAEEKKADVEVPKVVEKPLITDVNEILVAKEPREHTISMGDKDIKIKLKEPSWMDRFQAWSSFLEMNEDTGKPKMNFVEYYKIIIKKCLVEPKLTDEQVEALSARFVTELQKLLPPPIEA